MGCNCKGHIKPYYTEPGCMRPTPWNEAKSIVGLDPCGKIINVAKPEHELSELDREKLNAVDIDGEGSSALYNDGKYKKTLTKKQVEGIACGLDQRIETNAKAIAEAGDQISAIEGRVEANEQAIGQINENFDNYYTKGETDSALEGYYTKSEVDSALEEYYTQPETEGHISDAADGLRDEVAEKYLSLAGNSEQQPITGDVYTERRILARQTSPEITQWLSVFDAHEFGQVKLGSVQAQTDVRSSDRPTVNSVNEIAYLSDVESVQGDVEAVHAGIEAVQAGVDALSSEVDGLQGDVSLLETRVDKAETAIKANTAVIAGLEAATESGFEAVNDALSGLDGRVSENKAGIASNASLIEELRDDLAGRELFRGYYETTSEVTAIKKPVEGNYAWNAETGTVWIYNGSTWHNSGVEVPDQTVEASDAMPRMDGEGEAGSSNRYARGDHRHPSDDQKADVSALNDYLALAGNTQSTRLTGDIWMTGGQRVRLTNSGNSSIGQDTDTHTAEFVNNGVGGIDLVAPYGSVKANGQEIAVKTDVAGVSSDVSALQQYNEQQDAKIEAAQSGVQANRTDIDSLREQVDEHEVYIYANSEAIAGNTSDIESIMTALGKTVHFRGYYATTNEVTAIADPVTGDFAYNAQTGTKWIYNGETWADSNEAVPDQTVEAYEGLPLMDKDAHAGVINQYARGDHRHPTDESRASASELSQTNVDVANLSEKLKDYEVSNDEAVGALKVSADKNTGDIASLSGRMEEAEGHIASLSTASQSHGSQLSDLQSDMAEIEGRVSDNESEIASLHSEFTNSQNFRGYFLTTVEITQMKATPGDFAWNAQTQTVWIYDGEVLSWTDSLVAIPSGAVVASDALPLKDGDAKAGDSALYARGDHRHPTDDTRASASELANSNSRISGLQTELEELKEVVDNLDLDGEAIKSGDQAGGDLAGTYPNPAIANGAVTAAKLGDASVSAGKLAADIPVSIFTNDAGYLTVSELPDLSEYATTEYVNGAVASLQTEVDEAIKNGAAAGGDLTGAYPNPTIANGAVDAGKLAAAIPVSTFTNDAGYLTVSELPDLSGYATTEYVEDAVKEAAEELTTVLEELQTEADQAIKSGTAAGGDLTGSYPNPTIANGAVTAAKLGDASVSADKLAADIPVSKFSNDAGYLTSSELPDLSGYALTTYVDSAVDEVAGDLATAKGRITPLETASANYEERIARLESTIGTLNEDLENRLNGQ